MRHPLHRTGKCSHQRSIQSRYNLFVGNYVREHSLLTTAKHRIFFAGRGPPVFGPNRVGEYGVE